MKRIGIILVLCALWASCGIAATRVSGTPATTRQGTTTQRVRTQNVTTRKINRITVPQQQKVTARTSNNSVSKTTGTKTVTRKQSSTSARSGVVARAATNETRTGAAYEQCKNAFFACMDQFCQFKNEEYRRCSCSDRITKLQSARDKLHQAGEQLTAFNENLDIVGYTSAQATAMNTASEGELALTKDTSKSKALLNAIMDSIRGTSTTVEHNQLSSLNSIDLSFDDANAFGNETNGQTIASYNGTALYSAVYPQCRQATKDQCNDSSLQRAVNAYLMAIEQDCNTVQTAITKKQKETHNAIRESSSLLDMARAQNHQNHNADDIATCVANVESAILSEEVCGKNYHKCLDNGEYIDVSTGAPIAGVVDFYKLGQLLTFSTGRNNADQKLAQNSNNRTFVSNFEKRVKQFAEPALDRCLDDADTVWADYLNKALLDIYYAQQEKVTEIKQGCFDFVSACYMNGSTAMTNAMQGLVAAQTTPLAPNIGILNKDLCNDYIASCNNMFDGNIIESYIDNRHNTDSLTACRAVVKQCFDSYGGQNYENFYNPYSGLFATGEAPNWFSLYECTNSACDASNRTYKSECAKQIAEIDACKDVVEEAFGGFDYYPDDDIYSRYRTNNKSRMLRQTGIATEIYNQIIDTIQSQCATSFDGKFVTVQNLAYASTDYNRASFCEATFANSNSSYNIYTHGNTHFSAYNIFGITRNTDNSCQCTTQSECNRRNGTWYINGNCLTSGASTNCRAYIMGGASIGACQLANIKLPENMCPANYNNNVDVQSWGACLCWENGGRRSNNGTSARCVPTFPVQPLTHYVKIDAGTDADPDAFEWQLVGNMPGLGNSCYGYFSKTDYPYPDPRDKFNIWGHAITARQLPTVNDWCTGHVNKYNRVCPFGSVLDENNECSGCPIGSVAVEHDTATNTTKCCLEAWDGVDLRYDQTHSRCYYCSESQNTGPDATTDLHGGVGTYCATNPDSNYPTHVNTWSSVIADDYSVDPIMEKLPCGNGVECHQ